jgi:hypothetical protein
MISRRDLDLLGIPIVRKMIWFDAGKRKVYLGMKAADGKDTGWRSLATYRNIP